MSRVIRGAYLGLVVLSFASRGMGQTSAESSYSLRAGVDLVLVPVTVMDRRGALLTDLERRHFTVLQDNSPQPIVSFSVENRPCTLAIVLDTSQSMARTLNMAKALTSGVLSMSEPGDQSFLASVSDRPEIKAPLNTDAASVESLLPFIRSGGNTPLVDTVFMALAQLRHAENSRKAMLVVSDGMDNNSRGSRNELLRAAIEADVQIYTVSIGVPSRTAKPIAAHEEREGVTFLDDLAEKTGGIHFTAEFPGDVTRISSELGRALRDQYVIGYTPARGEASRKWHKIQIKLDVPRTNIYARAGYYSR